MTVNEAMNIIQKKLGEVDLDQNKRQKLFNLFQRIKTAKTIPEDLAQYLQNLVNEQ